MNLTLHADLIARHEMLTADVVRHMLARSLKLGFAVNQGNVMAHLSAVGVAIPARLGIPYAAFSVSSLTSRMLESSQREFIAGWLHWEAEAVARLL